jgi:hypothetical protein
VLSALFGISVVVFILSPMDQRMRMSRRHSLILFFLLGCVAALNLMLESSAHQALASPGWFWLIFEKNTY